MYLRWRNAVGSDFEFVEVDGWLAYSDTTDLIEQVRECDANQRANISTLFDERTAKELTTGHLSIFVNVRSASGNIRRRTRRCR